MIIRRSSPAANPSVTAPAARLARASLEAGLTGRQRHQEKAPATVKTTMAPAIAMRVSHREREAISGSAAAGSAAGVTAAAVSHLNSALYDPGGKSILTG